MLRSVRQLIERIVPWYDPEREAARDRRSATAVQRVDERVAAMRDAAMRDAYRRADERLSRGHR